jgi:acid-sensing ion channel, other
MNLCDIQRMECFIPHLYTIFEEQNHLYASDGVCKCLPACNSIDYKVDSFEYRHDKIYNKWYLDDISISFQYRHSEHFPLMRYQEFKTKDFLSYVGGLLGLFAGVSMLSIIEFIYFFTLRIFTNVLRGIERRN